MRMTPIVDTAGEKKRVNPKDGDLLTKKGYAIRERSPEGIWHYTLGVQYSELPQIYRQLLR